MGYLQVFINAIVVALMAMYVYENERKMEKMSTKHDQTENQQIAWTRKFVEVENQLNAGTRKQAELESQQNTESTKLAEVDNQLLKSNEKVLALEKKLVDGIKDMNQLLSTKAGIEKLTEIGNQQLQLKDKGVTYIRWGKTKCDGSNTETIYSGQVGGGHYTHTGASVNYICLPNNPEDAQPLKTHHAYAYLYGAEYEIYDFNKPQRISSDIAHHDVACATCLAKGKVSSILIPGRKTCYMGWTKEYDGLLMAGHHNHKVGSEYACVDSATEAIAGGSRDDNGILFYPVKTVCGSLKCPPYKADTEVLCVVCSK